MATSDQIPAGSQLSEAFLDYKGQVSFGRVGGFICLFFAMAISVAGLFWYKNLTVLNYCSTIGLQFLGAAVSLYIPSKASETFAKKWAPEISETVTKVAATAVAVAEKVASNLQTPKVTETAPEDAASGKATDD